MPFITIAYPPKYPLTESEKKWLWQREVADAVDYGAYSCPSCGMLSKHDGYCILRRCPRFAPNFEDVAEFEARVAAKLAETAGDIALLLKQAGLEQLSDWQLLRIARLAVEEEMQ